MKSFLEYVAEDIINKYGHDLSRIAIVFPNKRASLFISEYLAHHAGRPVWSPTYITISELFRKHTTLIVADPIKQVCDLHQSFCAVTGSNETLDHFYGWGQLLLADFDDIDKNMADADRVYANLRDIHELDDVSYLTEEQRQMIRKFFSNFTEEHNSELKERFLHLWSHFADIYHDFNQRLAAQSLAYEGALYRHVASHCTLYDNDTTTSFNEYDHYLFVGFNLIQKVEQQLFTELMKQGKAKFYWDFDHYYMRNHEAGHYIAQYLKYFPNELDTTNTDIYDNFHNAKQITYISAPTENIQARYISTWLREHNRMADGRRTAIVLCNEGLLNTVIHCLPDEVDKVNITTGFPLSQTPVASFIQMLITMQTSRHNPRHVRTTRRHPYARYIDEELLNEELPDIQPLTLLSWLTRLLRYVATSALEQQQADPLFQESLFRAYTLINRLAGLFSDGDLNIDVITLQRLISQLIQSTSIPFHGEPAEGIQIMGVLETRNLDFDHVLLLSCNEGNMPQGVNDSSFIPHSIRHAYELTTIDNKVAIYAYYFHRLLQRASDITLVYNNSTENGKSGEKSRFMLQLLVESKHPITQLNLQAGQSLPMRQCGPIEKNPHVMQLLQETFLPDIQLDSFNHSILTPSAINKYMRCPLQFFYRYVGGLKESDTPDEEQELDNRIFGNIFHQAADTIYRQLTQQTNRITSDALRQVLKNKIDIERAVDEAFHQELPYAQRGGLHLINREVIIHYLRQLLEIDLRLAPFTIIALEHEVWRPVTINGRRTTIGGRIDRLDLTGEGTPDERIRVIDYKTGSGQLHSLSDVEAIFDPTNIHKHSDYYLQALLYADIVREQHAIPIAPALLFIQHAAAEDYDPTLCFGKQKILDMSEHSSRFNELLQEKITDIFNPELPFIPTEDPKICHTCPYAQLCGR